MLFDDKKDEIASKLYYLCGGESKWEELSQGNIDHFRQVADDIFLPLCRDAVVEMLRARIPNCRKVVEMHGIPHIRMNTSAANLLEQIAAEIAEGLDDH